MTAAYVIGAWFAGNVLVFLLALYIAHKRGHHPRDYVSQPFHSPKVIGRGSNHHQNPGVELQ